MTTTRGIGERSERADRLSGMVETMDEATGLLGYRRLRARETQATLISCLVVVVAPQSDGANCTFVDGHAKWFVA